MGPESATAAARASTAHDADCAAWMVPQACINCGVGSYTPAASTECARCPAGRADSDYNEQTPCVRCAPSSYARGGGTECHRCPPGTIDHDRGSGPMKMGGGPSTTLS